MKWGQQACIVSFVFSSFNGKTEETDTREEMAQMETVVVVDQSESQQPKEPHLT